MIFVPKVAVIAIHQASISLFGGLSGIRDEGLLSSALARPEHKHAYDDANLFTCAAAYAFGIAKNHPFNDGNKRTAMGTTIAFLRLNGHILNAPDPVRVFEMEALAAGEHTEEGFAEFLTKHCIQWSATKA